LAGIVRFQYNAGRSFRSCKFYLNPSADAASSIVLFAVAPLQITNYSILSILLRVRAMILADYITVLRIRTLFLRLRADAGAPLTVAEASTKASLTVLGICAKSGCVLLYVRICYGNGKTSQSTCYFFGWELAQIQQQIQ
jgi:hypothetical protein